MEVNSFYTAYEKKYAGWKRKNAKVESLREEAALLEKKAAEKRAQAEKLHKPIPNWKEEIVVPLAKKLAQHRHLQSRVLGPMGIGAKVTIVLIPNANGSLYGQESYRLTLQPDIQDDKIVLSYETGETAENYKRVLSVKRVD